MRTHLYFFFDAKIDFFNGIIPSKKGKNYGFKII